MSNFAVETDDGFASVFGSINGSWGIFSKASADGIFAHLVHLPTKLCVGEFADAEAAVRAREIADRLMPDPVVADDAVIAAAVIRKAWLACGFEESGACCDDGNEVLAFKEVRGGDLNFAASR